MEYGFILRSQMMPSILKEVKGNLEMWMHQRLLVSRKITLKRRNRRLNGLVRKSWKEFLIYN